MYKFTYFGMFGYWMMLLSAAFLHSTVTVATVLHCGQLYRCCFALVNHYIGPVVAYYKILEGQMEEGQSTLTTSTMPSCLLHALLEFTLSSLLVNFVFFLCCLTSFFSYHC